MESQLQFCKELFQAVLKCQDSCKVPASCNAALLHSCQVLMLEAVQLQQVNPKRYLSASIVCLRQTWQQQMITTMCRHVATPTTCINIVARAKHT